MFLSVPGGRPCRMVGQAAGRSLAETGRDRQRQAETDRHGQTETDRDRETDRQEDILTYRQTYRQNKYIYI